MDETSSRNLRYFIPILIIIILLNLYVAKLGFEITGLPIAEGQCLSYVVISKTPDLATLHDGTNRTDKVNSSNDVYALQQVLVSPKYIYLNWTNNITDNDIIEDVILTLEHREQKINMSVQWLNETWLEVCDVPEVSSDTNYSCDLLSYIDTPEKANQVALRLNLVSTQTGHEKLDWALLNITYCESYDSDSDNVSDDEDNCPYDYNPEQEDNDDDELGDVCDEIWGKGPDIETNIANLTVEETKIDSTYVLIKSNNQTIVEFLWNQSFALNLFNVSIYKQNVSDSRGSLMITGINLSGSGETKTLYIDKILDKGYICILDIENTTLSSISTYCTESDELKLQCPGNNNGYECSITFDNRYKVSGLTYSTVEETENPTRRGGGGGSSCKPDWQCDDWGECDIVGYKHRECVDVNKCNILDGMPELSAKCSPEELCSNGIRDTGEEGIDCGGACEPCPVVEEIKEEVEEEKPTIIVQEQKPAKMGRMCEPLSWPYWLVYVVVIVFTAYVIRNYSQLGGTEKRRKLLLNLLTSCNILLVVIVILDIVCKFRWVMLLLVPLPLVLAYILLNILLKKIKKKKKK